MTYEEAKLVLERLYLSSEQAFGKVDGSHTSVPLALKKGIEACAICDTIVDDIVNGKVVDKNESS